MIAVLDMMPILLGAQLPPPGSHSQLGKSLFQQTMANLAGTVNAETPMTQGGVPISAGSLECPDYHSTPVETQNSFCSGSDILTHRVPPKLCTDSSMR